MGFLPDGRSVGVNLGCGFEDLSQACENALILQNKIHKLDKVNFEFNGGNFMKPWRFNDSEGRLSLDFIPFKEWIAKTNLGVIFSEVHQTFGRYYGTVVADDGEIINIENLIGFAEEHRSRWKRDDG